DDASMKLVAVRQNDTGGGAVFGQDSAYFRVATNLGAESPRRAGQRLRKAAHAAADVAPDAALAVRLAHDVVEENVGGAGRGRRGHRADDGVGGQGDLE